VSNPIHVLVVDDQKAKIAKIVDLLLSTGLCVRGSIEIAQSGYDARVHLQRTRFDLLVLDVVLPNRPEEEPKVDGGVDLLKELMTRDRLLRPRYIVGLTGYPEAFQRAAGEFADYTWAIVQYADDDISWHDPIEQLCRHIHKTLSATESSSYESDICVITALQIERKAMLDLPWEWTRLNLPGDASEYFEAQVAVPDCARPLRILVASSPRMGMVSAAILASNVIRTFRPRIIAIVGICAGLRDRVAIGDIAVADPSWDYQSGKFTKTQFEFAPHQLALHSAIRRRIVETANGEHLTEVRAGWRGMQPKTVTEIHVGPFASGSAVLANQLKLEELKLQHRSLIAIDMEVYGIFAAAADASTPIPYALAIKGISDLGDEHKDDTYREYACFISASFFALFAERQYANLLKVLF
jgi:nucleoside phosphorylase